jgi:hypothetical protein
VFARIEGYVARVIESLGLDAKGKRKKLEGNTITLSLRGCGKRAEVTDESARNVGVSVRFARPGSCEQVLGEVKSPKIEVSTSLVKAHLKADIAMPGTKLAGGTYLVRK